MGSSRWLSSQHQHYTDEAQRVETVLSAVIYIHIHIHIHIHIYIYIYIYTHITVEKSLRPTKVPRRQEDH